MSFIWTSLALVLVLSLLASCNREPTPTITSPIPREIPNIKAGEVPVAPFQDVAQSEILKVLNKVPQSLLSNQSLSPGIWFSDYARAWELAGLPPQPPTEERFLALPDELQKEYLAARRCLVFGPTTLSHARQHARAWQEMFGFDGYAPSLTLSTGEKRFDSHSLLYLELDFDPDTIRQHLLKTGYQKVTSVKGETFYRIDRVPLPYPRTGVGMRKVFLGEGFLSASPHQIIGLEHDMLGMGTRYLSTLADDPIYRGLAMSLVNPISAVLLPRASVLEHSQLAATLVYDIPEDWETLGQWEVLAIGCSFFEGSPWWSFSLFYPEESAAEADAPELVDRMNGYRTAITSLMYPKMNKELLVTAQEHPYPINESCISLAPNYANAGNGSILTVWCQVRGDGHVTWWDMLQMRDLGFLLP